MILQPIRPSLLVRTQIPGMGSFQVKSMAGHIGHQVKLRGPSDSAKDVVAGSNGAGGAAIFV